MTTHDQNMRMTLVGPDKPAGRLLRRYWQPVALIEELDEQRPVRAVKVLGQDFVLFRDEQGRYGLLDRDCPHRGTDLAFGRPEDGGLRCPFHGWLFDVAGRCLETPAEPEGSRLCQRIRQKSYPVVLKSGILFAYLGEGDPPAFADLDCFIAPDSHVFAFKGHIACNWLQALEVGIDPAHASFLHRFFEDEDPGANYGRQFRATSADSDMPMTKVLREFARPQIEIERTDYGMRLFALRQISERSTHVRVTNLLFPQAFVIPLSAEMTITQWHVPVDDVNCYWYAIFTSFGAPVDKAQMRAQRLELYTLPDYMPRLNKSNNYGFDPLQQKTQTYTGMGFDINVHDQWAVESQGPIQDRTREHLGSTDKAIINYRSMLMKAIDQVEKGEERPLMVLSEAEARRIRGPITVDGIAATTDWQAYWRDVDARKRQNAPWKAPMPQAAE
ncbi:aromatic ring-hydroxylating dioxygenase subunit alpha [uncultured Ferrovibrio sp.]|uniref:aromatic ring-hydroxylating dioxygenase subunit alpha n=1 Tax=uncultured Ferrovibrio sp. TaxID=1576913 RepID=UPI00261E9D4F|nr:aromatic ring-hydroxylating dioxygenase subunit alpha [uncultured Ferrovibrio sp.]